MAARIIKRRGPRAEAHERTETLYTYVTKDSKKFVKALSKKYSYSESKLVDAMAEFASKEGFATWFNKKYVTQKVAKGASNTRKSSRYA